MALIEIVLRNNVDSVLKHHLSDTWLTNDTHWVLPRYEQNYQKVVNVACKKRNKTTLSHQELIAELTLGFWVGLFRREYNQTIWNKPTVLERVFPNLPLFYKGSNRTKFIRERLDTLHLLRNRIAHHDPIFDYAPSLDQSHQELSQLLQCLSNEAHDWQQQLDRFPRCWDKHPEFM